MAELDFVTAPHNIPEEEEQYGWWFSKVPFLLRGKNILIGYQEDKSFDAHDHVECELGFQQR